MAQRTSSGYVVLISTVLLLFPLASLAQSCQYVEGFNNFNASKTVAIPALHINRTQEKDKSFQGKVGGLITNPDDSWYFTTRLALAPGNLYPSLYYINTGSTKPSDLADIGVCMDTTSSYYTQHYAFSKEVLERSLNDTEDCTTMLGNECANALKEHYARDARNSMMSGVCSAATDWNKTVPYQCASLFGGGEGWKGGSGQFGMCMNAPILNTLSNIRFQTGNSNLTSTWTKPKLEDAGCGNLTSTVNSTVISLSGSNDLSGYNQSIRFPQLHFLSFFPNRSSIKGVYETQWDTDVHVQLLCIKPDDIQQGSAVPPSAKELLDRSDASYADGITNNPSGTTPGGASASPSPTGAATKIILSGMAPYLGAVGMGLLMVV
jgi:hypothetical protein